MKRLKLLVRNLFGFSKTETNGFLMLLPLLLIVIFSSSIFRHLKTSSPILPAVEDYYLDSLLVQLTADNQKLNDRSVIEMILPFNPNNSTYEDLIQIGFSPHLALRTINYLKKGGRFSKTEDLLKIYGMDTALYLKILPWIKLPPPAKAQEQLLQKQKHKKKVDIFDLNLADTSQFQSLYGIGPRLASRIIGYRQKLGGFVIQDQLAEVYGLDSVVINLLKSRSFIDPAFQPKQLNVNRADEREMAQHPYISPKLAKIIAAYRFQHGTFGEIDDLLHIEKMDSSLLNKIRPYLKVEP